MLGTQEPQQTLSTHHTLTPTTSDAASSQALSSILLSPSLPSEDHCAAHHLQAVLRSSWLTVKCQRLRLSCSCPQGSLCNMLPLAPLP